MINPQVFYTEDGECVFSVSELNMSAKELLQTHFATILITGEISNFSKPASGHIYFSLKDEHASIRCAWFKRQQSELSFSLENGLHVVLTADVTVYCERGEYQLLVRKVYLAGEGLLKKKLDALKRKLADEGLFAAAHKKPLPFFPKTIGIITSKTGAALQDVLVILKRRAPFIRVRVYACQVQGVGAADTIIRALNYAIVERQVDALLLTRGGGSNEDLFAFNNEQLAYAIFNCPIPLVSAVGHEIDLSIADFVADVRAPTPSAAAEIMSPNQEDLFLLLQDLQVRLRQNLKKHCDEKNAKLNFCRHYLVHPKQKIIAQQQILSRKQAELNKIIHSLVTRQKLEIDFLTTLIYKNNPQHKIPLLEKQLNSLSKAIHGEAEKAFSAKRLLFLARVSKLQILSPINTLQRGYSILYTEKNKVLSDVKQVRANDKITAQLDKGKLTCIVEKVFS